MHMSLLGLQYPPSKILIQSVNKDKYSKEPEKGHLSVLISVLKIIFIGRSLCLCSLNVQ